MSNTLSHTAVDSPLETRRIALVGNPNCGKTALFNLLTGSKQKVANYAGVTVERKEGRCKVSEQLSVQILDLPGAYSLDATSPDEAVTRDVLHGQYQGEAQPELIICVMDATNLDLHLRFALELTELGRPMIIAMNMMDSAQRQGITVDIEGLSAALGIPVVETVAVHRHGASDLLKQLQHNNWSIPTQTHDRDLESRYHHVKQLLNNHVTHSDQHRSRGFDDQLDALLLNPLTGMSILATILFFIFQAVFSWAAPLMEGITAAIDILGSVVTAPLAKDSALFSMVNDGIIAGLGNVLIFLPQILILFFFILVLEESGYLPRAAYLLDKLMFRAGLTGRAFIPLLSSFACAIPGIMATRSIQDPRDRLITILVAPLMTCSARLPVYTLLIAAFIPRQQVAGLFNLQGVVLFALYFAGILSALLVAYVMKWLQKDKSEHALLMELPAYRIPNIRDLAMGLMQRASIFLRRVGGIIFSLTILLWVFCTFPSAPADYTGAAIDYSIAGRLGHGLAIIFAPIGFNWQICIALIPGMAAREVAVSALATVYAMSGSDELVSHKLGELISQQWSVPTALSLLAWFVFAPQCLSTLAVIRRETNSWRTMGFAAFYLFALAYLASLIVFQVSTLLLN
ncbi:Fe(2+) transporter FeoB [Zhongshania aliphaticivorans]|uniref:Fe(2+) transporter FeoB n=1 Tax=Zhongshania aliphaticivorans TaxID=1470434 RepID=A0A5S9P368_9GAMM|nr:ferrous iron transporter B [Zhongshania aliphaticivorans]CAA0090345.1 Fe(2+) transporter FeoB [Zhongshania aliphaticivorans]CAA0097778.1 Fe(2+) transporter FeoB [Zhongshania aliphaticivorans]